MKYSCCAGIEYYDAIASAGYDEICLPAVALMRCNANEIQNIKSRLKDGALECNSFNFFCGPELRLCGTGYQKDKVKEYSKAVAELAHEIGVNCIGIGGPKSRSIYDNFERKAAIDQFCECLQIIDDELSQAGVMTLLEAVCRLECNFIINTKEALDICEKVGRKNVGMVYDLYHAMAELELPEEFLKAREHIRIIHLAENVDNRRCYLSENAYEAHEAYFKIIRECDFDGVCAVEAFEPDILERLKPTLGIMRKLNNDI